MTEEMAICPKCSKSFPVSNMYEHLNNHPVSSTPSIADSILQSYTWPTKSNPVVAPPLPPVKQDQPKLIKPENISTSYCPKCGTQLIITELYRVCSNCKYIKVRPKIWWWFILRYGLMIAWICLLGGFIWGISWYHLIGLR